MNDSIVYALDFDGVICDSAVETGITGWKAAFGLWKDMPETAPAVLIDRFRQVRPVIETGYEAILTMRLLYLGESVETIYRDFSAKSRRLMDQSHVTTDELKKRFGETRDRWIADDLAGWVEMNPLFDGIAEKLHALGKKCPWYVVTTKQERFVRQILNAYAIDLEGDRIFGLDRNMSKPEVLKGLLKTYSNQAIYFVEDRLPTLLKVRKNPDLDAVKLIFALWGYNTDEDKAMAAEQLFVLQRLEDFLETPAIS